MRGFVKNVGFEVGWALTFEFGYMPQLNLVSEAIAGPL
jgi:hypothetical protein